MVNPHSKLHAADHQSGSEDDIHPYVDHGSIQGLNDDDHTIYAKADGTRPFTGAVEGVTPTASAHLATKGYVDSVAQGLDWQDSVLDKDLTEPPAGPSVGDRYIVAAGATGDWSGHDNEIAEWNGSSWDFTSPSEGMCLWVEDENLNYVYDGANWVKMGTTISHADLMGLSANDHTQYLHTDGSSNPLTGPLDVNNQKIANLADPTSDQHAVNLRTHRRPPLEESPTEPTVTYLEWKIWKDTSKTPYEYWLIFGSESGNVKVQLS